MNSIAFASVATKIAVSLCALLRWGPSSERTASIEGMRAIPSLMTHFGFEKVEGTLVHRKGLEREPFLSDNRIV